MSLLPSQSPVLRRQDPLAINQVLLRFCGVASAGLLVILAAYTMLTQTAPGMNSPLGLAAGWPVWFGVALYACCSLLALRALRQIYPHTRLGLCNAVTQMRLALTCLIAACVLTPAISGWATLSLAALCLALDGVDGWLARRARLTSHFGARFDLEVDSVLALGLAVGAFLNSAAGPAVLLLGVARYLFGAAAWWAEWLRAPLPERWSRKAVCVLQIGCLVILQAPGLPPAAAEATTLLAAAALAWSFGVDIAWLWRRRTVAPYAAQ